MNQCNRALHNSTGKGLSAMFDNSSGKGIMGLQEITITSGEGVVRFVYLIVVTIAIIVGNTLVIVAVAKFKKLRKITNIMLASLSVADLMVGVITVPLYIAWTMHPTVFDQSAFLCRSSLLSSLLVVAASQLNLIVLSIERFLAVTAPFKHKNLLNRCPWLHTAAICVTWVISFATTAVSSLAIKSDYIVCNYYNAFNSFFLFFAVIFGIFIPFIAIIIMNIKVYLSVIKYELRRKHFVPDNSDSLRQESSDQEYQPPSYGKKSRGIYKNKQSMTGMVNVNMCCIPLLRNQCFPILDQSHSIREDALFQVQRYSLVHHTDDNPTPQPAFPQTSIGNDVNGTLNSLSDTYSGNGLRNESDHLSEVNIGNNHQNDVHNNTFISSQISVGSNENLMEYENTRGGTTGYNTESYDNIEEETNIMSEVVFENQPNYDANVDSFISQGKKYKNKQLSRHNFDAYFKSLDHIPLLVPETFSAQNANNILSNSYQLHSKKHLFKTIDTLATPRLPTKQRNGLRKACQDDKVHCDEKDMFIDQVKNENGIRRKMDQWNVMETLKINSLISSKCKVITEAISLQNLKNIRLETEMVTGIPNDNHITQRIPLKFGDNPCHKILVNNEKTSETKRWLSDDFFRVKNNPKFTPVIKSSSNINKIYKAHIPTQQCFDTSTSSPKPTLSMNDQRQCYLSSLHLQDNTSVSTYPSQNLTRNQSVPALCSLKSFSQPECTNKSIESSASKGHHQTLTFKLSKEQIYSPGVKRIRKESLWQAIYHLRKMSSIRDGILFPRTYVSKRVARTVALVCFSFIIAWLPFFIVIIVNTFCAKCNLVYILNVVLMITFAQSASNPVIYALCHASFRNAYKDLINQMCLRCGITRQHSNILYNNSEMRLK